jgi:hypothetical protein
MIAGLAFGDIVFSLIGGAVVARMVSTSVK